MIGTVKSFAERRRGILLEVTAERAPDAGDAAAGVRRIEI